MERNLLVGNGINIQFGGLDVYSGYATMNRVVENIKAGKYTILTENALDIDAQLEVLSGMVKVIDQIKAVSLPYFWKIIFWHLRYLTMGLGLVMVKNKMRNIEKLCLLSFVR